MLKLTIKCIITILFISTVIYNSVLSETILSKHIADLSNTDPNIRHTAVVSLSGMGDLLAIDPLLAVLEDPEHSVRGAAVDALGVLRAKKAAAKISDLLRTDPEADVRRYAAIALRSIGDSSASVGSALVEALADEDAGTKLEAVKTAGRLRIGEAVDQLIVLLDDENARLRKYSIKSLGSIGDISAVNSIQKSLRDTEYQVRVQAAYALAKLNARQTIPHLKKRLKDPVEDVALASAVALAMMQDGSGRKVAGKLLNNSDLEMRKDAIKVFKLIGRTKDTSRLKEIQEHDSVRSVQTAASRAITAIEQRSAEKKKKD